MIYLAVIIAIAFGFLIGMIINDRKIIGLLEDKTSLLEENEMFKNAFVEVFDQLPAEIQLKYTEDDEDEKHFDKKI